MRARADQAVEQARFNVQFERSHAAYVDAHAEWQAEKASPAGIRRAALRAPGRRIASAAWYPVLGLVTHALLQAIV